MKKYLFTCSMLLIAISGSYAQQFKPFKVSLGLGFAVPSPGEGAGGGALIFAEPGYRLTDAILVGFRLESAIIARGIKNVGNNSVSGDASSNVSYTLNGQYYINDRYARPFVGLGLGLFSLAAVQVNNATNPNPDEGVISAQTSFGFYPRVGIDVGHFNFTLDYNFIPPTKVDGGGEVKNSYLGIRAGFSIGGGIGTRNGG
jgi:hypothetical protein